MAITGMKIFKLLPKTNCIAFAMSLAAGEIALDAALQRCADQKPLIYAVTAETPVATVVGAGHARNCLGSMIGNPITDRQPPISGPIVERS